MDGDHKLREQALTTLCEQLQIEPSERLLIALTHPSFANEQPGTPHNQRLEFLGDAVLGLCVSELLMAAFERVDEGQLTVMRAALVNTVALAEVARSCGLAAALRLGRGADSAGERERTNVLADAVEAVVAAVYLDSGLERARALTNQLIDQPLSVLIRQGGVQRDAKSRLQEYMQGRSWPPPHYEVVATDGPPHDRIFTVEVVAERPADEGPALRAQAAGSSKKLAAQRAADKLLQVLHAPSQHPAEAPDPVSAGTTPATR